MSEHKPLAPHLEVAVEQLAARVHEAWVENRVRHGWQLGEQRDDETRLSPLLVPYEELAQAERELDRVTVRRTLAGLEELGYRVEPNLPQGIEPSREQVLIQADRLIGRGQPLPAYDLTKRWLAGHPDDRQFLLLNARALRRCGALHRALRVLDGLGDGPDADGEHRGLLAAVHKEIFVRSYYSATSHALDHLRRAQQLYQEVFDETGGTQYWHGINAATLAFLAGREDVARSVAQRVWTACEAAGNGAATDYWLAATRGEAALVQGRFEQAAAEYRIAVKAAGDRTGDIASTRQNAMLLLDAYAAGEADRRAIETALRPPAVVIFAGPPLDREDTPQAYFPAAIESEVRAALDERLQSLGAGFGYSGAAPGTETLFLEAMLERQPGVVNVVLPWPREQFADTHVRAAGESWLRRFEALLGDAARLPKVQHVVSATLGMGIDSPLYEGFARQLLFGLARLHAKTLATDVVPLVIWDSARSRGQPGQIDELVERWRTQGIPLTPANVIDLGPMLRRRWPRQGLAPDRRSPAPVAAPQSNFHVMAILFADVEDYSKIAEHRLPSFVEYFVGGISSRLGLKPYKPANVRRVGDGLLMVFSSVRDAALCALELVEWASAHSQPATDGETFWSRVGLPHEMRVRVALHAGPVFECVDPLTHSAAFEGAHINYAARIEPVTPGNQVYASEAFAALAASWPFPCEEFACEYVGRTSLAKKFGEYPLYHVRRR